MRRRAPFLVVSAALGLWLSGITPAVAGGTGGAVTLTVNMYSQLGPVNESLLGTNQPVAGAAAVVQPLGVDWERADMSLDDSYSCATGAWNPTALDTRVQEDLAMGGEPELIVDYSPPCMTSNPLHETLDPPDASGYAPWASLVEQVAYHEMVTYGVHIFEVWNEPDGTFWHGTLADYLAMYRATAGAISEAASRAEMSDVLIGGPALLFPDPVWLNAFLGFADTNHLPVGFVSWHYYGDYPELGPFATGAGVLPPEIGGAGAYWYNPLTRAQIYGLQVQQVKTQIARYPDLHPLTVIDEWNLDAGYDPRSDQPYDAAFAAAVLDSVQSAGLDRMAFFRVADDEPGTLGNWGMLFSDLTPKPVYWTFDFWHSLAGTRLESTITPSGGTPSGGTPSGGTPSGGTPSGGTPSGGSPSGGDVGAVASVGVNGGLNLLVYNYVPFGSGQPDAVTVRIPGLAGTWSYIVRMIDTSHSGDETASGSIAGPAASFSLKMPANSVALVELLSLRPAGHLHG